MASRGLSHIGPVSDEPLVNGMFFDRGAAVDYDAWAYLGNPGWGFDNLLPYFEKVWRPLCDRVLLWIVTLGIQCGY